MDTDEPQPADTAERNTLLDSSLERVPPIAGLDMQRQRQIVHARLFGRPAAGEAGEARAAGPARSPDAEHIGRYLVRGTLGQGGMGKVLLAHDETLGRDVALKVLHEARERHGQRLLREAQALARLTHPNVVRVYDVDEIDGRLCMAMELVQGTSLDRWQQEPRAWTEVLAVYCQAGRGLAAAHAEGLVHRDFKPANCILDDQGIVKVLDFGLARGVGSEPEAVVVDAERTFGGESQSSEDVPRASRSHSSASGSSYDGPRASRSQGMLEQVLTRTGTMLGTLAYMAPEQLLGKPADPRSDQFAFCVSLYDAAFGRRPFGGSTAMALLYSIQSQRLDPPATRPGLAPVPKWLFDVLRRGLAVAAHQRFSDMEALLAELDRGLARRRRVRVAALGTVLAAGLAGALAMGGTLGSTRPCEGVRGEGMPAWTDEDRQAVGAAIEGAGLSEGARVRERVEERLDAYALAWSEARADACEDTWVRHEAGEQALARRMACLDERVVSVDAVVEQLAQADRRAAAFAPAAVDALPPLAACADVEELLRGPAPVPAALADEAAAIRELVARSWAAGATGDDGRGMEAADRAVEAAEALVEAPALRIEALYNRGHLLRSARRWGEARRDLEAALSLAEQSEDDGRAIDVLIDLLLLAGDAEEGPVAAAWLAAVTGKLARFENDPRRVAQRAWLEGVVALLAGRVDDAVVSAERAVSLYSALEPAAPGEQLEAMMLLSEALRRADDPGETERALAQTLALAEEAGHFPLVARALYKQAYLDYTQGRLEAARPPLLRSLELRDAFFGPHAAASIRSRHLLSVILQQQGALSEAIEQARIARASFDDGVPVQLQAEVLMQLASLQRIQLEWHEAIESYREARTALDAAAVPDRIELAMLDASIADCLVETGELQAARELYDAVIELLAVMTAPDDSRRAYARFGRAQLLLRLGERQAAIADLRAALALEAALVHDAWLVAELRWTLGRALGPADPDALKLVQDARSVFSADGNTARTADIDAWLGAINLQPQRPRTRTRDKQ